MTTVISGSFGVVAGVVTLSSMSRGTSEACFFLGCRCSKFSSVVALVVIYIWKDEINIDTR